MSPGRAVLVVVVTIVLAAFFAGSETAVISCSKVRLRYRADAGSWRARALEKLLTVPERFFSVVLVGTNLAVITCTAAATALFVHIFHESGSVVATVVMTPLILIIGEVIPKSAFLYHADRISIISAPALILFYYILIPLVIPATLLARGLMRLTGLQRDSSKLLSTREELIYLYRRGKKEGSVERRERLIINRVFGFQRVRARELMVPIEHVVSFPVTASVEEVIEEANRHTFSRFPIVAPDDGRICGIISLFDLLGLDGGEELSSVMHPPLCVRGDESAEKLLVTMKREAMHMAVVTGPHGEIEGVVTLEDVLENIVGDIANEFE
ncbi:MAG: HlyC/CorC family transporter [bacterium]|nr:MAG: HlyC/CorC family transporter [bacterium]